MSMHYVYVLFLNNAQLYAGRTDDLRQRFHDHTNGKVKATKNRRPVQLFFYEAFISKTDAIRRERYLKTNKGKKMIKLILKDALMQKIQQK